MIIQCTLWKAITLLGSLGQAITKKSVPTYTCWKFRGSCKQLLLSKRVPKSKSGHLKGIFFVFYKSRLSLPCNYSTIELCLASSCLSNQRSTFSLYNKLSKQNDCWIKVIMFLFKTRVFLPMYFYTCKLSWFYRIEKQIHSRSDYSTLTPHLSLDLSVSIL